MSKNIDVTWHDLGRQPSTPFDREYPDGRIIDVTAGRLPSCQTDLDWPAPRCGQYLVHCRRCGFSGIITTAGRVDDPRQIIIPCKVAS